jgi:hypothetical protein
MTLNSRLILLACAVLTVYITLESCGRRGPRGYQAPSCRTEQLSTGAAIICPNGSYAVVLNGKEGPAGSVGPQGGVGNSVSQTNLGSLVNCTDGTSAVILNGTAGTNAPTSAYNIVQVYDPCGTDPGYNEVLLHLSNGSWLAHFTAGTAEYLTLLPAGNYQTADATGCRFTVDSAGAITNEHH